MEPSTASDGQGQNMSDLSQRASKLKVRCDELALLKAKLSGIPRGTGERPEFCEIQIRQPASGTPYEVPGDQPTAGPQYLATGIYSVGDGVTRTHILDGATSNVVVASRVGQVITATLYPAEGEANPTPRHPRTRLTRDGNEWVVIPRFHGEEEDTALRVESCSHCWLSHTDVLLAGRSDLAPPPAFKLCASHYHWALTGRVLESSQVQYLGPLNSRLRWILRQWDQSHAGILKEVLEEQTFWKRCDLMQAGLKDYLHQNIKLGFVIYPEDGEGMAVQALRVSINKQFPDLPFWGTRFWGPRWAHLHKLLPEPSPASGPLVRSIEDWLKLAQQRLLEFGIELRIGIIADSHGDPQPLRTLVVVCEPDEYTHPIVWIHKGGVRRDGHGMDWSTGYSGVVPLPPPSLVPTVLPNNIWAAEHSSQPSINFPSLTPLPNLVLGITPPPANLLGDSIARIWNKNAVGTAQQPDSQYSSSSHPDGSDGRFPEPICGQNDTQVPGDADASFQPAQAPHRSAPAAENKQDAQSPSDADASPQPAQAPSQSALAAQNDQHHGQKSGPPANAPTGPRGPMGTHTRNCYNCGLGGHQNSKLFISLLLPHPTLHFPSQKRS